MSLSRPSDVSPTTGSDHDAPDGPGRRTKSATSASRTTPTLCVLVIAIGVVSMPDSRIHSSPVISPLPLSRWQPANTGSWASPGPRGRTTVTPVRTGPRPSTSGPSPSISVVSPTRTPATSVIALNGPGRPAPDRDPQVARPHPGMLGRVGGDGPLDAAARIRRRVATRRGPDPRRRAYHRPVIPTSRPSAPLRMRRLPDRIAAMRAIDAAEAFRDLPGLVLLESARPGRNARWTYLTADPVAVLESPAAGPDPFAVARRLVARLDPTPLVPADARRSSAAWSASSATTSARSSSACPSGAPVDQDLPPLRLALHDWVVAWDRRTGHAWIGGRALDGDGRRLARRLDDVHARLTTPHAAPPSRSPRPGRSSSSSSLDRAAYQAGVERIREHIARGDIYQANLTRRLETPFDGDPWDLYRRLRTGDPSLFSAYLDLGPGRSAAGRGRSSRRRPSRSCRSTPRAS